MLEMFCLNCKEMFPVYASYDCIETWSLERCEYKEQSPYIELLDMVDETYMVGVHQFECSECGTVVIEHGWNVVSEERLLEIIDQQFMD